jgi:hypothetical protein
MLLMRTVRPGSVTGRAQILAYSRKELGTKRAGRVKRSSGCAGREKSKDAKHERKGYERDKDAEDK